jgi:hypothetical protein
MIYLQFGTVLSKETNRMFNHLVIIYYIITQYTCNQTLPFIHDSYHALFELAKKEQN